jgi:hypothetical protein
MQIHLLAGQASQVASSRTSVGRVLLALLVACSLSLSFFHGWSPPDDADVTPVSNAAMASDLTSKAPVQHLPGQADHCLMHLVAQASQETAAVPAEFGALTYPFCDETLPARLAGLSPFKPPRA